MADDEILTIREVAALLKFGEKTACTMAHSGEFPGFKEHGQWRFRRNGIDAWIEKNVVRPVAQCPEKSLGHL